MKFHYHYFNIFATETCTRLKACAKFNDGTQCVLLIWALWDEVELAPTEFYIDDSYI